jgi:hypothetical protein
VGVLGAALRHAELIAARRYNRKLVHISPGRRHHDNTRRPIGANPWLAATITIVPTPPRWRFLGLAVGRETSNVCVHPEKERERMKCALADIEGLSVRVENLRTLGPEKLDQTWRELFGSERPRRVYGDLLGPGRPLAAAHSPWACV